MPDPEGLRHYEDGRWILHRIAEVEKINWTQRGFSILPFEHDHVLVMLPDRLLEYDPMAHRSTTLKTAVEAGLLRFDGMAAGPDGIWITGRNGIARLDRTTNWKWSVFFSTAAGLSDLQYPLPGNAGELFATGRNTAIGKRVLVRLVRGRWEIVPTGAGEVVRGWRGEDDSIWVQEQNKLFRISGERRSLPVGSRCFPARSRIYGANPMAAFGSQPARALQDTRRHCGGLRPDVRRSTTSSMQFTKIEQGVCGSTPPICCCFMTTAAGRNSRCPRAIARIV